MWTSAEGLTWRRVPDDAVVFGSPLDQQMSDVARTEFGLVAVGIEFGPGDIDAAVWTSPDGLSWRRVPDLNGVFSGEKAQFMHGVVGVGRGAVAIGFDEAAFAAAVWSSSDGPTWQRVGLDNPAFAGTEMYGAVAGATGVVAVGGSAFWTARPRSEVTPDRGSSPRIVDVTNASGAVGGPNPELVVVYRDAECDVTGGTWYGAAGSGLSQDFSASGVCRGEQGTLVYERTCRWAGRWTEYVTLIDARGNRSPRFSFVFACK